MLWVRLVGGGHQHKTARMMMIHHDVPSASVSELSRRIACWIRREERQRYRPAVWCLADSSSRPSLTCVCAGDEVRAFVPVHYPVSVLFNDHPRASAERW